MYLMIYDAFYRISHFSISLLYIFFLCNFLHGDHVSLLEKNAAMKQQ